MVIVFGHVSLDQRTLVWFHSLTTHNLLYFVAVVFLYYLLDLFNTMEHMSS